jgi:hypothetical protein
MNERIKQLAEQAGIYKLNLSDETEYWIMEKFAELIVGECVGIVEGIEPGYKDYRDQIEDAFRRDCVAEIKQYFGVEE